MGFDGFWADFGGFSQVWGGFWVVTTWLRGFSVFRRAWCLWLCWVWRLARVADSVDSGSSDTVCRAPKPCSRSPTIRTKGVWVEDVGPEFEPPKSRLSEDSQSVRDSWLKCAEKALK